MATLTANDLVTRFGEQEVIELSDRENRQNIDYQVVNKAVEDAQELAQSYYNAAGLFGVAFDAATVAKMADVAIYRLCEDGASETRIARHNAAIKWFEYLVEHPSMVKQNGSSKATVGRSRMVRG